MKKKYYIDIGSSVIKVFEKKKNFSSTYSRSRSKNILAQLKEILSGKIKKNNNFLICSSANGGLRVALIYYTKTYSGDISKQVLENAGCNVIFYDSIFKKKYLKEIDLVILVGGLNIGNYKELKNWIYNNVKNINYKLPVIFSGNERIKLNSKKIIRVQNFLGKNFQITEKNLTNKIKNIYIKDIVDKKNIIEVKNFFKTKVYPTPLICNRAFSKVKKIFKINNSPNILIDMGGATTDLFYDKECLKNSELGYYKRFDQNRFVFQNLGVLKSKESTMEILRKNPDIFTIMRCVFDKLNHRKFLAFRDQKKFKIKTEDLFYMILLLILNYISSNSKDFPNIDLNKIKNICITGGITQILKKENFKNILKKYCKMHNFNQPNLVIDSNYKVWTYGFEN